MWVGPRAWLCRVLSFCAVLGVLGAAGCERRTLGAGLLDVTGVESGVLERGDTLRIVGAGFPAGRDGEVLLRGMLRAPGAAPRPVRMSLPGHARSAERVELLLDEQAHAALGGRGSFDGSLELRFAAARAQGDVIGRLERVQLDLLQTSDQDAREDQALRERALDIVTRAGITLEDADTLHGLSVASVAPESSAQRAGLRAGDVITTAAGVRVHALSDLAPVANAGSLALSVRRSDVGAPLLLTLPLVAASAFRLDASSTRLCALLSFVLLVLLFASPFGSPTPLILRTLSTLRSPQTPSAAPPVASSRRARVAQILLVSFGAVALGVLALELLPVNVAYTWLGCALLTALPQLRGPRGLLALLPPLCVLLLVLGCACI
jgi:PDZ domain-containing protein